MGPKLNFIYKYILGYNPKTRNGTLNFTHPPIPK